MNKTQIREAINADAKINIPSLMWVRQTSEVTDPITKETKVVDEPWVSVWDNPSRTRISMHQDILDKIKENPNFDGLTFKKEVVAAHGDIAAYTRYVVIVPTKVVAIW